MTTKTCPTCKGKGWIPNHPQVADLRDYYNPRTGLNGPEKTCPDCNGEGLIDKPDVK